MNNNFFQNTLRLIRYNIRIIFGGKFGYFILGATLFFLVFGAIMAFEDATIDVKEVYGLLLFPAILLVFYPSAFGIQNDADQRTLEIIFGIPDYRYKVWLVRLVMVIVLTFVLLFPFAGLAHYALVSIPIFKVVGQLMPVVFFVACVGFGVSTLVRNGNAAGAIMIIIALVFFIINDAIRNSKWNLFLNPFRQPDNINEILWQQTVYQNRIILLSISIVMLLLGLLTLQRREKFLR